MLELQWSVKMSCLFYFDELVLILINACRNMSREPFSLGEKAIQCENSLINAMNCAKLPWNAFQHSSWYIFYTLKKSERTRRSIFTFLVDGSMPKWRVHAAVLWHEHFSYRTTLCHFYCEMTEQRVGARVFVPTGGRNCGGYRNGDRLYAPFWHSTTRNVNVFMCLVSNSSYE